MSEAYEGTVHRTYQGHDYEFPVMLISPGDWPEVRESLPRPEEWATLRLGPFLIAFGAPTGPARVLADDLFRARELAISSVPNVRGS